MRDLWRLPEKACIGGKSYGLHTDYRDILEIFSYLEDPDLSDFLKWRIALALFYEGEIPPEHYPEAIAYFSEFVRCGQEEKAGARLIDWGHDALAIVADVNRVAGQEIRALPHLHWWTFLSYFHAIGEGQLSMLVSLREKLAGGKRLEPWEQAFYRENKKKVDLPKRYTAEEREQLQYLQTLLEGGEKNGNRNKGDKA